MNYAQILTCMFFFKDMPNVENSETDPLLDEEDGDKEEEPSPSADVEVYDVEVPFVLLLSTDHENAILR